MNNLSKSLSIRCSFMLAAQVIWVENDSLRASGQYTSSAPTSRPRSSPFPGADWRNGPAIGETIEAPEYAGQKFRAATPTKPESEFTGNYISPGNNHMNEMDGWRAGFVKTYISHTIAYIHYFTPWLHTRPGIRYDYTVGGPNVMAPDLGTTSNQFTVASDFVLRF